MINPNDAPSATSCRRFGDIIAYHGVSVPSTYACSFVKVGAHPSDLRASFDTTQGQRV